MWTRTPAARKASFMALARAAAAGLILFLACVVVGHNPEAPPTTNVVEQAAPAQPHDISGYAANYEPPATTTTSTSTPPRTSRQATHPRVVTSTVDDAFWRRVANCESPSNARSRNGKWGGYFQMTQQAWLGGGGDGVPETHDYATQLAVAKAWAARTNPWRQWPVCWPRAARGG